MTDSEIIKALEHDAISEFDHWVIDFINRQKAEIERLNEELRRVQFDYLPIDALMDEFCSAANYNDYGKITLLHIGDIIDRLRCSQLVKEPKKVNGD